MKKHLILCCLLSIPGFSFAQPLLRVGVAGLSHDHALGLMNQHKSGKVIIAGIAEKDTALVARYKRRFQLPDSLFFPGLEVLLAHTHPDVVLAYNPIDEHLQVVEACAPKGVSVMVEKPLAVSTAQANRMAALAKQYHIHLLTNYETTWYASNQHIYTLIKSQQVIGPVRKMIVHDGHQGPKEIGCSADFLHWLTDPDKNGGGAIIDFGCYGANLMTWLMDGQAPIAVTAVARHIKPDVYPKVDDDATILLEYPEATGIIEASWNWPFGIKDWEVFGKSGYLHALNSNTLQQRQKQQYEPVTPPTPTYTDNISYLADVLSGKYQPDNDLSSLQNNLIVVQTWKLPKDQQLRGKELCWENSCATRQRLTRGSAVLDIAKSTNFGCNLTRLPDLKIIQ